MSSDYTVKIKSSPKFKVSVSAEAGSVAGNLADLDDVNVADVQDSYVIMYAATQTYKAVNPDEVFSKATTEPVSPGLPQNFINQLDVDLDDKIDIDAGTF